MWYLLRSETPLKSGNHLGVHFAMVTFPHLKVGISERLRKMAWRLGDKINPLFIKFVELVDPTNGIVGFWFAVCEINHSCMTQTLYLLVAVLIQELDVGHPL